MEHFASLEEIERSWSLDDVLKANAILDMQIDLLEDARRKVKNDNR